MFTETETSMFSFKAKFYVFVILVVLGGVAMFQGIKVDLEPKNQESGSYSSKENDAENQGFYLTVSFESRDPKDVAAFLERMFGSISKTINEARKDKDA